MTFDRILVARILFTLMTAGWAMPERKRPYGNAYGNATGTSAVCLRSVVEFSGENGAPERIRTADPQIRSLVGAIEIIEVRYRKMRVGHGTP